MFFFLPLGTTRPCRRVPYATYALVLANIVVFALQTAAGGSPAQWGFVPAHPSLAAWFTSLFTHDGIFHLSGNMLFLWLFGTIAEDVLGPWLFLAFYFGGDLGATLLHTFVGARFAPNSLALPSVGASGAIAGIMGLSAVCFLRTKVRIWYVYGLFLTFRAGVTEVGAPLCLGLWVGWEAVQGLVTTSMAAAGFSMGGGVAHWAHVGGFAAGFGGALALGLHQKIPREDLVTGRRPSADGFEGYSQSGELEKIVQGTPNDPDAWYALGRACEVSAQRERAGKAFQQALVLFLRYRRFEDAVKAYNAAAEYNASQAVPDDLQFELACALEAAGKFAQAFDGFIGVATEHPNAPEAETALLRAGDLARTGLHDAEKARQCYDRLIQDYPQGQWRGLAMERRRTT